MAQRVFRTIGTAADDVKAVFGDDATDLAAQFLVWALAETERCVVGSLRDVMALHCLKPVLAPSGVTSLSHRLQQFAEGSGAARVAERASGRSRSRSDGVITGCLTAIHMPVEQSLVTSACCAPNAEARCC